MPFLRKAAWRFAGMAAGVAALFITLAVEHVSYGDPNVGQGVLAGMIGMGVIMTLDSIYHELNKS